MTRRSLRVLAVLAGTVLTAAATSPFAQLSRDCDSFPDAFTVAAFASAASPELGVAISTDAKET